MKSALLLMCMVFVSSLFLVSSSYAQTPCNLGDNYNSQTGWCEAQPYLAADNVTMNCGVGTLTGSLCLYQPIAVPMTQTSTSTQQTQTGKSLLPDINLNSLKPKTGGPLAFFFDKVLIYTPYINITWRYVFLTVFGLVAVVMILSNIGLFIKIGIVVGIVWALMFIL